MTEKADFPLPNMVIMEKPELNEYFIKIKGTLIKSTSRTTATEYQEIIEASGGKAALNKLEQKYDIQEVIAVNKL